MGEDKEEDVGERKMGYKSNVMCGGRLMKVVGWYKYSVVFLVVVMWIFYCGSEWVLFCFVYSGLLIVLWFVDSVVYVMVLGFWGFWK